MYPGTWAPTTPDKPAHVIAETGETTTYAELDERSLRMAHVLADAGGVNHHLSAAEAAYIVDDCGAKALVVSASKTALGVSS